jgi:membrane peptidoglycan carboxypeptidase
VATVRGHRVRAARQDRAEVVDALIATEDRRFYDDDGIELTRTAAARPMES